MKQLIINILTPVAVSIVAFYLGYRKYVVDAKSVEINNVNQVTLIWRQLAQDLKKEVDELKSIVNELSLENEKLKQKINSWKNI
jgi:regulator of replication initiation timing